MSTSERQVKSVIASPTPLVAPWQGAVYSKVTRCQCGMTDYAMDYADSRFGETTHDFINKRANQPRSTFSPENILKIDNSEQICGGDRMDV